MSSIICVNTACNSFFLMSGRVKPSVIYEVDEKLTKIENTVKLDEDLSHELRFVNATLSEVVDTLNASDERYTVYLCDNIGATSPGVPPTPSDLGSSISTSVLQGQVVSAPKVSELTITGLYSGSIPEIVRDIAISYNLKYSSIGSSKFYIGLIDKDYLVDYICESDLTTEGFEKLLEIYDNVKAVRVGSRVFVRGGFYDVRDFVSALSRFDQQAQSYLVNLVFIRSSRGQVSDIKARVEFSSIDLISSGYSLLDVFEAHGAIDMTGRNSRFYLEQELLCNDGVMSRLKIGNDREQEQRSISDQGTSTVQGYRTINDGIELEITPRSCVGDKVDVKLTFTNSKFDDASSFNRYKTDVSYDNLRLQLNKVYYVASLEENTNSRAYEFLGLTRNVSDDIVTVWLSLTPVTSKFTRENF